MLKTQVQEIEPNKVALTVEVGKDRVAEAFSSFFQRAARSVNVPGFRKGKIPRYVLTQFLGSGSIKAQIEEELLKEIYPQAIREAKLHPVSPLQIEESTLKEGQPFTFKAVVEVRPTLPEFVHAGHTVTVPHAIVDDAGVEKVIERLREQFTRNQPLDDGHLEMGDYFLANIQISCEGTVDAELSEEKGYHKLTGDAKAFLPLKGLRQKESRTYDLMVEGDENKDSKYFGKTLQYNVMLNRISRPQIPALNDEFAKEVGDYQTLGELKAKIREDLEKRSREDAEEEAFNAVVKQIADGIEVRIPEAMIQHTIDYFIESLDRRYRQFNTTIEEYLKKAGKDTDEFRESFRDKATYQTKVMLIVDSIGDRQKIEVTDAEYRAEIELRAKDYNMPVERLVEMLRENDGEENIRFSLRSRKIREFLLKNNQVHYDMVKEAELNKGETQGDAGSNSH